jgi:hypothetical protein
MLQMYKTYYLVLYKKDSKMTQEMLQGTLGLCNYLKIFQF